MCDKKLKIWVRLVPSSIWNLLVDTATYMGIFRARVLVVEERPKILHHKVVKNMASQKVIDGGK